jgi:hypothetical protein
VVAQIASYLQTNPPDLRHIQNQADHLVQTESMTPQVWLKAVVERHGCTIAAAEPAHCPAAPDIHPVVAECEPCSAEPKLGSVVGQLLRIHTALVVEEGVGPVAVQGTHAKPVARTYQHCFSRNSR